MKRQYLIFKLLDVYKTIERVIFIWLISYYFNHIHETEKAIIYSSIHSFCADYLKIEKVHYSCLHSSDNMANKDQLLDKVMS